MMEGTFKTIATNFVEGFPLKLQIVATVFDMLSTVPVATELHNHYPMEKFLVSSHRFDLFVEFATAEMISNNRYCFFRVADSDVIVVI